jgi:predicted dehydrogenase
MSIRWGIVGCGDVCEVKSGPGFQRAVGSELVAVMRRDGTRAEDFARRHGVPAWYDDADRLIADPRVDAVYIASPPGSHLELALRVAKAGKPAYVEKPMARNYAECEQMLAAFAAAKLPLFVAYYRRRLPRFLKAKEHPLPWRLQAEHAGGGLFLDLASHTLDVLDFLFGPLQAVSGEASKVAAPGDVEDRVVMRFATVAGARGSGSWDFSSQVREDRIEIVAEAGTLRLATFGDGPVELVRPDGVESHSLPNPAHIQQPLIQSIVDSLLQRGSCPSTGETAARTSEVMDRALLGYYGSRDDGFWNRPERWPGRRV